MYEHWYDYVKPKNGKKAKLCYIDTDSFIIHLKVKDIYADFAGDVKKRKIRKIQKIRLMKDELGERIMEEFAVLRRKTYSHLINNDCAVKKAKGTDQQVFPWCK